MDDNREYEISTQQKFLRRICSSSWETLKISHLHNGTSTLEENTDINIIMVPGGMKEDMQFGRTECHQMLTWQQ